jgi:hypothetical protein
MPVDRLDFTICFVVAVSRIEPMGGVEGRVKASVLLALF